MRLEASRIVSAWLKDATYGYAAKLAALSLDASDTALPTTVADASIVADVDNVHAAFGRFDGLTLPAIIVSCMGSVEWRDGHVVQPTDKAYGTLTVQVRYAERTAGAATAVAHAAYALRAITASLRELHSNDNIASRTRNSVRLVSCEGITELGVYEETEDTYLVTGVEARYEAVTILPLGA